MRRPGLPTHITVTQHGCNEATPALTSPASFYRKRATKHFHQRELAYPLSFLEKVSVSHFAGNCTKYTVLWSE